MSIFFSQYSPKETFPSKFAKQSRSAMNRIKLLRLKKFSELMLKSKNNNCVIMENTSVKDMKE